MCTCLNQQTHTRGGYVTQVAVLFVRWYLLGGDTQQVAPL